MPTVVPEKDAERSQQVYAQNTLKPISGAKKFTARLLVSQSSRSKLKIKYKILCLDTSSTGRGRNWMRTQSKDISRPETDINKMRQN